MCSVVLHVASVIVEMFWIINLSGIEIIIRVLNILLDYYGSKNCTIGVGPGPHPVRECCPLSLNTILTSPSPEMFRITRCSFCETHSGSTQSAKNIYTRFCKSHKKLDKPFFRIFSWHIHNIYAIFVWYILLIGHFSKIHSNPEDTLRAQDPPLGLD